MGYLTALVELATLEASLEERIQILHYYQQLCCFNMQKKYLDRVIAFLFG